MALYAADGARLYLTSGERAAFLKAAERADREDRTLCMTLAYAGCRLSEAQALTADNDPRWWQANYGQRDNRLLVNATKCVIACLQHRLRVPRTNKSGHVAVATPVWMVSRKDTEKQAFQAARQARAPTDLFFRGSVWIGPFDVKIVRESVRGWRGRWRGCRAVQIRPISRLHDGGLALLCLRRRSQPDGRAATGC
jgi:integrase